MGWGGSYCLKEPGAAGVGGVSRLARCEVITTDGSYPVWSRGSPLPCNVWFAIFSMQRPLPSSYGNDFIAHCLPPPPHPHPQSGLGFSETTALWRRECQPWRFYQSLLHSPLGKLSPKEPTDPHKVTRHQEQGSPRPSRPLSRPRPGGWMRRK